MTQPLDLVENTSDISPDVQPSNEQKLSAPKKYQNRNLQLRLSFMENISEEKDDLGSYPDQIRGGLFDGEQHE